MSRVCDLCYQQSGGTLKSKRKSTRIVPFQYVLLLIPLIFERPEFRNFTSFWALSDEVMCKIFGYLDLSDLVNVSLVCKKWAKIANLDLVWKTHFNKRWIEPDAPYEKSWKDRYYAESNWEAGIYSVSCLRGHNASISCVQIAQGLIISGSVDTKIKIWSKESRKLQRTLEGHASTVRCIYADPKENLLVSGSEDKVIKVWDFETGKRVHTLRDHTGEITCLQIEPEKKYLATGSGDKTIKVIYLSIQLILEDLGCQIMEKCENTKRSPKQDFCTSSSWKQNSHRKSRSYCEVVGCRCRTVLEYPQWSQGWGAMCAIR